VRGGSASSETTPPWPGPRPAAPTRGGRVGHGPRQCRAAPPADLLAQALAAATAIPDDYYRARALTGLAPHLPADLLAQAQGSAPRDQRTLVALLERAWTVHERGARLAYVALLRDCLIGINRDACLGMLVAAAPAIAATGGYRLSGHARMGCRMCIGGGLD
jgi:hypothetical protein